MKYSRISRAESHSASAFSVLISKPVPPHAHHYTVIYSSFTKTGTILKFRTKRREFGNQPTETRICRESSTSLDQEAHRSFAPQQPSLLPFAKMGDIEPVTRRRRTLDCSPARRLRVSEESRAELAR